MKRLKIGLLARIIIAITLGIGFGNVLPGELVRVFVTFNGIFSEFLGFIIPLIILGLVTPAIADIGKEAGKMLVITTLVAYSATLFSGFLSYFTGVTFFPSMITPGAPIEQISEAHDISPFFTVAIPPVMNVMTSLILAFTLGLGIAHLDSTALKNVCNDFKEIIVKTIQTVILPLLPIYIFGIFLNMTHSGQVYNILMVFIKIIGVIFLLHIFLLVFQYTIAALFVHIIRKTKCFDFWERNVLFPKTKRSFFRTPTPLPCPFPLNFSLLIITKKFGNLAKNRYICIV